MFVVFFKYEDNSEVICQILCRGRLRMFEQNYDKSSVALRVTSVILRVRKERGKKALHGEPLRISRRNTEI